MASDRVILAEGSLSADLIAQQNFSTARRGFDPDEVRAFLAKVAAELLNLHDRQAMLEAALRDAEYRVAHPTLDEETLLTAVGEETSHILRSAHEASADIKSRAEENASRILKEAHAQAETLRGEAESVLARRTEEAEAVGARILETAKAEGERLGDQARQQAKAIRSQSEAERKAMIDGASATREKILTNLARKRKVAVVQVEQLLAGRERLLESYQVVRDTLEQVTTELARAETTARAAADAVRLRPLPVDDPDTLQLPVAVADVLTPMPESAEPEASGGPGASGGPEETAEPEWTALTETVTEAVTEDVTESVTDAAPSTPWPRQEAAPEPDLARPGDPVEVEVRGAHFATTHRDKTAGSRNGGPAPAVHVDEDPGPAAPEPATAPEPEASPASEPASPVAATTVDSLFARIRADREAAVGRARDVLADTEPSASPSPPPASGPVAEAVDHPLPDADEALLQRRDEVVGAIEAALTRRLKRALQDEQNDMLDRLRGMRIQPTAALVLPKRGEHAARFAEASRPFLGQAAEAGASFVASLIGERSSGGEGLAELEVLADNLAGAIVAPLRRRLEEVMAAGDGDDRMALAESVGTTYREWKTQRIELTAADHVASAFAGGAFAATPAGTPLRWLVEDTGGPCPDCDDNVLAGELPKGERFPTGQRHPPAHTGCRCLLVPNGS